MLQKTGFGSSDRKTIFSGKNKVYDEVYKTMIGRENSGPKYNIREGQDDKASFQPKKITSQITGFSLETRPIGAPNHTVNNPPPNKYYNEKCANYTNKKISNPKFGK